MANLLRCYEEGPGVELLLAAARLVAALGEVLPRRAGRACVLAEGNRFCSLRLSVPDAIHQLLMRSPRAFRSARSAVGVVSMSRAGPPPLRNAACFLVSGGSAIGCERHWMHGTFRASKNAWDVSFGESCLEKCIALCDARRSPLVSLGSLKRTDKGGIGLLVLDVMAAVIRQLILALLSWTWWKGESGGRDVGPWGLCPGIRRQDRRCLRASSGENPTRSAPRGRCPQRWLQPICTV